VSGDGPPGERRGPLAADPNDVDDLTKGSTSLTIPDETVRRGKVRRFATLRAASASCLTHGCGRQWNDAHALTHGSQHAEMAGHVVLGEYRASYVYWPAKLDGGVR
jgi:hypothetical protein